MANGDAVLRDLVVCAYTDDGGNVFLNTLPSYQQSQAALGWALASGAQIAAGHTIPKGLKKRRWLLWNPADHTQRASVPIGTNAAYIAAVVNATTVLMAYRGYELTMTVYGLEGERRRGRRTDIAVEASIPV